MGLLDFLPTRERVARDRAAARLYAAAVTQARLPGLYQSLGAPDTLEGRFELIVIHVHLLCRRLPEAGAAGAALAQTVFDTMFHDMDRNLRELGVGDPSMPRRIKAMLEAYYGRINAYEEGLVAGGDRLAETVARNVYNAKDLPSGATAIADYMRRAAAALEATDAAALMQGDVAFASLYASAALRAGGT